MTPAARRGRAQTRRPVRSTQPRRPTKIRCEARFGKVIVIGDPSTAASRSLFSSSAEKIPCRRYGASVATCTGIATARSSPSRSIRKKLIAATPTTRPSSTPSEISRRPTGFRSNHHSNSASSMCDRPTPRMSSKNPARSSGRYSTTSKFTWRTCRAARVRPGDRVLEGDKVACTAKDELEGASRIGLDVVAAQAEAVAARAVRARDRGEAELVAGLADEAQVDGQVVGLRALHEREGLHRPTERLLEPQLRDDDLARRLVEREVGHRPVADPVALDSHALGLELAEFAPVHRPVPDSLQGKPLLVRERPVLAEEADRDEEDGRVAVLAQDGERVLEVVAVAVVEGDERRARRERLLVHVVVDRRLEVDDPVAELAQLRHLLIEERGRHGDGVAGDVVDLVVHERAERPPALAVERARAGDGLADRAVDPVLQELPGPRHLHQRLSLSTASRSFAAYSSGVDSHGSTLSRARAASRSASSRSLRIRTSASASAPVSPGSTRRPFSPSRTRSGIPPTRVATTGRPRHSAPTTTRPIPSEREGRTSVVAASSVTATSAVSSRFVQLVCSERSTTSRSTTSVRVPDPTIRSRVPSTCGAASRHASASPSTFLYSSSTPTKSACGRSGSGLGGARNGSRSMKAGKTSAGSSPTSRTSSVVYGETARTASACRSVASATWSASGESACRSGDP